MVNIFTKIKIDEIINLYAAFDIYFVSKKDVRNYPFALTDGDSNSFRLYYLKYGPKFKSNLCFG